MKKILAFLTILSLLFGFASCSGEKDSDKTTSPSVSASIENSTEKNENKETCGAILTVQKYRTRYYSIPGTFVSLVGKDKYFEWLNTVDYSSNAERMLMPQFIKQFGITREQFDKANLKFAKIVRDGMDGHPCINPKDYANQIDEEIFNADIIFTFNDEVINNYYLTPDFPYLYSFEYEEAVANGEYVSQTTDWIDIEALEAEIIAKYGEAEIVTEETETTATEETSVIPTEPIETTSEQTKSNE